MKTVKARAHRLGMTPATYHRWIVSSAIVVLPILTTFYYRTLANVTSFEVSASLYGASVAVAAAFLESRWLARTLPALLVGAVGFSFARSIEMGMIFMVVITAGVSALGIAPHFRTTRLLKHIGYRAASSP